MTGSKNYQTRPEFTQESELREALGYSEHLLVFANTGYCIDAPEVMPAGSVASARIPFTTRYAKPMQTCTVR